MPSIVPFGLTQSILVLFTTDGVIAGEGFAAVSGDASNQLQNVQPHEDGASTSQAQHTTVQNGDAQNGQPTQDGAFASHAYVDNGDIHTQHA